jgi:hypothetical protein
MSEPKFTPGPWGWFGNTDSNEIYLATPDRGMRFIMRFRRWGMNKGQPSFQLNGRMIDAKNLVKFDVGDGQATGVEAGKADPGVYRMDVVDIDHPDARLIAAAPCLLAMLQRVRESFVAEGLEHTNLRLDIDALIARATGQEVGR